MTFLQSIIDTVGLETYKKLEKESDNEVALSLKMPLKNQDNKDNYYSQRDLRPILLNECEMFENKGLKISPIEVVNILFKCKTLFAVKDWMEYTSRVWDISQVDEFRFAVPRNMKKEWIEKIVNIYLEKLSTYQYDRIFVTEINSYNWNNKDITEFLEYTIQQLSLPYTVHEKDDMLYVWYKVFWSEIYVRKFASIQLRVFLSILKIAWFIHPWQIEFRNTWVEIMAPKAPVFWGTWITWWYCRDEDMREPRDRVPDWCLWRSFWYRGISKIWLDQRNKDKISSFYKKHRNIIDAFSNPWSDECIKDISPVLEILSSSTQVPDVGAKILLIYCCLEHLFVPKGMNKNQKNYIVGGIKAINSDLLDWFDKLYNLRCSYAHKWFIKRDKQYLSILTVSFENIMDLLNVKILSKKYFWGQHSL